MAAGEGLRALKKQRTRHDIVVATLELTLEDSYRATTIPLIAERAMVSPRTVSAYFPNKDEIAFDDSALRAVPTAWAYWERAAPSYRKVVSHWVTSAKRPETRQKRMDQLVADCAAGQKIKSQRWG